MDEIVIYANEDNQLKIVEVDAYESDHFEDADIKNEDIALDEIHLDTDTDSDGEKDDIESYKDNAHREISWPTCISHFIYILFFILNYILILLFEKR